MYLCQQHVKEQNFGAGGYRQSVGKEPEWFLQRDAAMKHMGDDRHSLQLYLDQNKEPISKSSWKSCDIDLFFFFLTAF